MPHVYLQSNGSYLTGIGLNNIPLINRIIILLYVIYGNPDEDAVFWFLKTCCHVIYFYRVIRMFNEVRILCEGNIFALEAGSF